MSRYSIAIILNLKYVCLFKIFISRCKYMALHNIHKIHIVNNKYTSELVTIGFLALSLISELGQ